MIYKVDLNSNAYFSTTNANTTANRTYGLDWSFLKQDKKYLMDYKFISRHAGTQYYPPVGVANATLNTNTLSGQAYGNGSYTASASSVTSGIAYNAVDKDALTKWRSAANYTNSLYTGTTATTTTDGSLLGEWLQIQLPTAIVLDRFYIQARDTSAASRPLGLVVLGSSTGVSPWNIIYSTTNTGLGTSIANYYTIINLDNVPPAYSYYRFVVTQLGNSSVAYAEIWDLTLYDYNNPPVPAIISINNGIIPQNIQASRLVNCQPTNISGVLQIKGKHLYANPYHNPSICYNAAPSYNYSTINLLQFDGVTPITTNDHYTLTMSFTELS